VYAKKTKDFYVILLKKRNTTGTMYITTDKRYVVFGNVFDLKEKMPLTITPPVNEKVVKEGISFTYGNGKKEIYIVTYPECPFCKEMEKSIKDKLVKNYKVHYILYPLPFHPHAKQMSCYILAGKTDKERFLRFKNIIEGDNKYQNAKLSKEDLQKCEEELKKSEKAVKELGTPGTPFVYDRDFNIINPDNLLTDKAK
jgi:thiol:disulfide interchange protein DsbC